MFESSLVFGTVGAVELFHTLEVVEYHRIVHNFFFSLLQRLLFVIFS